MPTSALLRFPPLVLALALLPAPSAPPDELADVRRALATFSERPLSEAGADALALVVAFAEASDAVSITVSEGLAPWVADPHAAAHSDLLLGAYVAGSVRSQLDSGVKRHDPWCGLLQVFAVYRELQAAQPEFESPPIESLLNRHRRGMLAAHLEQVAASEGTADAKPSRPGAPQAGGPVRPPEGLVSDAETAIRIAVAVWEPIYGKERIAKQQPWRATLEGDTWKVTGSLPEGTRGGVAEALVAREDAQVLRVTHGK